MIDVASRIEVASPMCRDQMSPARSMGSNSSFGASGIPPSYGVEYLSGNY